MKTIDLRSDTVTRPTEAMRKAMYDAQVGDDVYAEDPTVIELQNKLADMTGYQAGLFMPTGTMTNQVALATHAPRGHEVIMPQKAHIYEYEIGSLSVLSGLIPRIVEAPLGVPAADEVRRAIHHSIHQAPTGLITLENTHNTAGGTVVPLDAITQIAEVAKEENLPFHLDGARAFNAAAALGVPIKELVNPFDSVSICLSKGLAAPVGSVLLGSKEFINKAHRYRKMFGGGMRQAGVIAAAGIVALDTMVDRLTEDHRRARDLAIALNEIEAISVDLDTVQTNIIFFKIADAAEFATRMAEKGVLSNALSDDSIRLLTHYHIDDEDIADTIKIIKQLTA